MRNLTTFLLAFVLILSAYTQEDEKLSKSEIKKLRKEQQKAEREAEMAKAAEITNFMITQQKFVLEADYLSDKTGSRISVMSSINFVMVDSLTGTLQLGSAMQVGYNGVGGATIEGQITNYKYTMIGKKKDSYSLSMNIMSSLGTYDITMMINADGNADATIRGNWGSALNYHGIIVPLSMSRVYKGHSLY